MIALSFIGDGPRDQAIVPRLVARLLNTEVAAQRNQLWKGIRLNRGGGFDRKLLFAIAEVRTDGVAGVIATIDEDAMADRMPALIAARSADRERHPALPVVLGEARPHGEAWLLDDPTAIRQALGLGASVAIEPVHRSASPKEELERLHLQSPASGDRPLVAFARIADALDAARCLQHDRTGFGLFVDEVRRELGPLVES